jgi:hypothetical protein
MTDKHSPTPQERAAALEALNDAENHLLRMSQGYHVECTLPMNYKEWVGHCLETSLATIRALLTEQGPETTTIDELALRLVKEMRTEYEANAETDRFFTDRYSGVLRVISEMYPNGIIVKEKKA